MFERRRRRLPSARPRGPRSRRGSPGRRRPRRLKLGRHLGPRSHVWRSRGAVWPQGGRADSRTSRPCALQRAGAHHQPGALVLRDGLGRNSVQDPEMSDAEFLDMAFSLHISPLPLEGSPGAGRGATRSPRARSVLARGLRSLPPSLAGATARPRLPDFLLHDVANPARYQVGEPGVDPESSARRRSGACATRGPTTTDRRRRPRPPC